MFVAQDQSTHSGRWLVRRDVTDCKHRRRGLKGNRRNSSNATRGMRFPLEAPSYKAFQAPWRRAGIQFPCGLLQQFGRLRP